MTTLQLPYKAEYAKSGRAGCKKCKENIEKGTLRLAIMVASRFHDGRDAHWHHADCFFQKKRPETVGDIEDFESLRFEDQKMIESKIAAGGGGASAAGGGKGKGKGKKANPSAGLFCCEYAKSNRSECVGCNEKIPKDAVRISKKDFESEKAQLYGGPNGLDRWHHVDCFVKIREELEFFAAADKTSLPGFKDLDKDDQNMLKKCLPAITASKRKLDENGDSNGAGPSKRIKTEKGGSGSSEERMIKKQNELMYKNRDAAESGLKKGDLIQILRTNKQDVPDTATNKDATKDTLDLVADILTFGAMEKCPECKEGQFKYKSGIGYQCTGYINEFTKCGYIVDGDVKRKPFKVPNDLREHSVFAGKTFKVTPRVIPKHAAPVKGLVVGTAVSAAAGPSEGPRVVWKPLAGFKFALLGIDDKKKSALASTIKKFGGEVKDRCSSSVAAAIMLKDKYDDSSEHVNKAKKYGVPVVSTEFVDGITEVRYKLADELSKYLLSDWVKDIRERLKVLNNEFEKPREKEEKGEGKVKLRIKDGAVIDPDSGLDDGPFHIYKEGKLFYNCVLNRTDVDEGKNSFYKLQLIESDRSPKSYYVFRAWGRIGTTSGGHKTEDMPSKSDAIDLFQGKYEEMTGNVWGHKFVRKPGKYVAADIDYGQAPEFQKLIPSSETSSLPLPVQSLVSLIFDVDMMKKTMLEFEIDMDKMPLGKLSRKQILEAYSVLTDSLNLRDEKDERKLNRMIADVSNRFYTLIPHNFGLQLPPLLNDVALIKSKIDMLDNLMEIEIAYELLAHGDKEGGNTIDSHYKSLNTDIDVVEANSEEYKILSKYLANTHAPTHTNYTLDIDQIFKVVRKGEHQRYRPFKEMHNRRLLWHGSRVSNFAGIISQGLRIAPPEAPVTGYMFGKGIYFADMVSKSANYCWTSPDNPTGLLLLCEVALGDMHELKDAKDTLTKPPKDCHSVKGLGQTEPDPTETYTFKDGVMVPYGKPTKSKVKNSSLLYNEYIVYDTAQVNIKYLLKVNFNYEKRRKR